METTDTTHPETEATKQVQVPTHFRFHPHISAPQHLNKMLPDNCFPRKHRCLQKTFMYGVINGDCQSADFSHDSMTGRTTGLLEPVFVGW